MKDGEAIVIEHESGLRWKIGHGRSMIRSRMPLLMGIINVTPDSFSDGGQFLPIDRAVSHAKKLISEGADILDVGGESTRPGAEPVDAESELRRVIPLIEQLSREVEVPISIDTSKAQVAHQALLAGASIVNDVTGLMGDPDMIDVCRKSDCGLVVMHMQGKPQTMQNDPTYDNVVAEICNFFRDRLTTLNAAGIDLHRVVLDPGIGFGKTAQHNIEILASIRSFHELGRPLLIGHSRKRFLKKVLGKDIEAREFGTVGVSVALAHQSVDILRVHDVGASRDAILAYQAICQ